MTVSLYECECGKLTPKIVKGFMLADAKRWYDFCDCGKSTDNWKLVPGIRHIEKTSFWKSDIVTYSKMNV